MLWAAPSLREYYTHKCRYKKDYSPIIYKHANKQKPNKYTMIQRTVCTLYVLSSRAQPSMIPTDKLNTNKSAYLYSRYDPGSRHCNLIQK